jgi:hypothetical protein
MVYYRGPPVASDLRLPVPRWIAQPSKRSRMKKRKNYDFNVFGLRQQHAEHIITISSVGD